MSPCAAENLTVLELDNCPLITDASLDNLVSCHNLQRIELYDCQLITHTGIRRLRVIIACPFICWYIWLFVTGSFESFLFFLPVFFFFRAIYPTYWFMLISHQQHLPQLLEAPVSATAVVVLYYEKILLSEKIDFSWGFLGGKREWRNHLFSTVSIWEKQTLFMIFSHLQS